MIKKIAAKSHLLIALDISSKAVGICIHCDGRTESAVVDMAKNKEETWQRILRLAENVRITVMELANIMHRGNHETLDIYVEQPFYSNRGSNDTPIKMAHGAILGELARYYSGRIAHYEAVSVNTWRAWFLGKELNKKGTDKKAAVRGVLQAQYGRTIASDDECDSCGLMAWVLANRIKKGSEFLWRK